MIKRVVYSFVVADLFHFGHLQLLNTAKSLGDFHICGVLSDEAAESYRSRPISNYDERVAVISSLHCVDRVIKQDQRDPTVNLKRIHAEFPEAKLVLVHGNDWQYVPGKEYMESIQGEVVQPEYYRRLSDSRIQNKIFSHGIDDFELFTEYFKIDGIKYFHKAGTQQVISTKANTLRYLRPLLKKSRIEKSFVFRVLDWKRNADEILDQIQREFQGKIVVRSSALNEDHLQASMAGYFYSELNISSEHRKRITEAIKRVIESYIRKGADNDLHQVLIQAQTSKVQVSGVVLTRQSQAGLPYYVINYDNFTGMTDTVTGGYRSHLIEISKFCDSRSYPEEWRSVLEAVKEIERLIPEMALDIEFAMDQQGKTIIYQVRPLVASRKSEVKESYLRNLLRGEADKFKKSKTAFSDMAFWNPAEMIGDRPSALSLSLYRFLITQSAWNEGLVPLGYTNLTAKELMAEFAGKPYIDLRKTFNALLPASILGRMRHKLVEGCLEHLRRKPELHDKVEFEILDSCFLFDAEQRAALYKSYGLRNREVTSFQKALTDLTVKMIENHRQIFEADSLFIKNLRQRREKILTEAKNHSSNVFSFFRLGFSLLADCRIYGTPVFARQARMAFMGNAILRSLVQIGLLSAEENTQFFSHLQTVTKQMSQDYSKMARGQFSGDDFYALYGHLRPNTYDISSRRYDQMPELLHSLLKTAPAGESLQETKPFFLSKSRQIQKRMAENNLPGKAENLFDLIRTALENREKFKFEFSKNISEALELFARVGKGLGLSRQDLAEIPLRHFRQAADGNKSHLKQTLFKWSQKNRHMRERQALIPLPSVVFSTRDFYAINHIDSRPNFITRKSVKGELEKLGLEGQDPEKNVEGKIVLIENADPGYDWIFTKKIAGLITRFGGVASHMAIRCAEFGIPAAIGAGDIIFTVLKDSQAVHLDCEQGVILPLAGKRIEAPSSGQKAENYVNAH